VGESYLTIKLLSQNGGRVLKCVYAFFPNSAAMKIMEKQGTLDTTWQGPSEL